MIHDLLQYILITVLLFDQNSFYITYFSSTDYHCYRWLLGRLKRSNVKKFSILQCNHWISKLPLLDKMK